MRKILPFLSLLVFVAGLVLAFDERGTASEASFKIVEEGQIGDLVGKDLKKEDVVVSNVQFSKENGVSTFIFEEGGYVKVKDKLFMNVKKGGVLKSDEKGEIVEADITSQEKGVFTFGSNTVKVNPWTRVVYKNNILDVYGEGKQFTLNDKNTVKIGEQKVSIAGDTVSGKNFQLDDIYFKSEADVRLAEDGYLISKDAEFESQGLNVKALGGLTMKKECSNLQNDYLAVCRGRLLADGSMNINFKKGNKFVAVPSDDTLSYEIHDAKVSFNKGLVFVDTKEKGSVTEFNGEYSLVYSKGDISMQVANLKKTGRMNANVATSYENFKVDATSDGRIRIKSVSCKSKPCQSGLDFHKGRIEDFDVGSVSKLMEPNIGLEEEMCSKAIQNIMGPSLSEKMGLTGHAWDAYRSISGETVDLKEGLPVSPKPGDIVFINNPISRYKNVAGDSPTHMAVIIGNDDEGKPVIYHQWGGKQYIEPLEWFVNRNKWIGVPVSVEKVVRPEFELPGFYDYAQESPFIRYVSQKIS